MPGMRTKQRVRDASAINCLPNTNEPEGDDDDWHICWILERMPLWYGELVDVPIHQVAPVQSNIERLQHNQLQQVNEVVRSQGTVMIAQPAACCTFHEVTRVAQVIAVSMPDAHRTCRMLFKPPC
jgi:hypothetical protein